jgi:hypothetical protein
MNDPPEALCVAALVTVGPVTRVPWLTVTGASTIATGREPGGPAQLTASWYGLGTDHAPGCWAASAKPSARSVR